MMCSIAARISANGLEITIHDAHVDVAQSWMLEGSWQTPDNFKAKALPQPDGALVGADYEIELHRAKSARPRAVQRMRAHRSGHAAAHRRNGCHVAAIGDVRSAALLVCLEAVSSNDVAIVLCDEHFTLGRQPVRERARF